jgi:hypothetical protein
MALKTITKMVTVTTAGTRVQVNSTTLYTPSLLIQADPQNSGYLYVGNSEVADDNFIAALAPGESLRWERDPGKAVEEVDLSDYYLDSASDGNIGAVSYPARK